MNIAHYIIGLAVAALASAAPLNLTCPATAAAGKTFTCQLSQPVDAAVISFTLAATADIAYIAVTPTAAVSGAGKQAACGPYAAAALTCSLFGFNALTIPPGKLADVAVKTVRYPASKTLPLTLRYAIQSPVDGSIASAANPPVTVSLP